MKAFAFVLALACAFMFMCARQAAAQESPLAKLLTATQSDYDDIMSNFKSAGVPGQGSWEDYKKKIDVVIFRISARRKVLEDLDRRGLRALPAGERGLARLIVRDLDNINLSILALIRDERGHAGYLRTGDEELVKGINAWQEGIRLAIKESRRCIAMTKRIAGPFFMRPRLTYLRAH